MDKQHQKLLNVMISCTACKLAENRKQVVVGDYGPKEGICFIGEAPGAEEDRQGRPFVGRSGKLLDEMLDKIEIGRNNVSVLNIAKCRPPNNRNPTTQEQNTCASLWLHQQLKYLNPIFIVTLGSVPLNYFSKGKRITKVKGEIITEGEYRIYPMLHPAYVLRGGSSREDYLSDFIEMREKFEQIKKDGYKSSDSTGQVSLDDFF